ncbi:MAG: hypothetical protein WD200_02510 [Candidatus Andersenbacteria bacterium]
MPIGLTPAEVAFNYSLSESPVTLPSLPPAAMANDHPDAPKQFGIRLSEDTMKLVSEIQHFHQRNNQSITLAAIVEDAIECHYNRLVSEGAIKEKP